MHEYIDNVNNEAFRKIENEKSIFSYTVHNGEIYESTEGKIIEVNEELYNKLSDKLEISNMSDYGVTMIEEQATMQID